METNRRVSNVPSIASLVFFLSFFLFFFSFPFFSRLSLFVDRDSTSSEKSGTRDVCFLFFWGEKIYRRNEFAFTRHFWILATHFLDISCIWCTKSHISEARDEERSRLTGETRSGYSRIYNIFAGARTQHFVIAE